MADIFNPKKRSEIMSAIRGKNTKPELLVYRFLRKSNIYFQKHYRSKENVVLDVALPSKKKAVMIDGDFWHGRTLDKIEQRRGKNDFWVMKLKRNIARDAEQSARLNAAGWKVLRVWESEIIKKRTQNLTLEKIADFLIA